MRSLKLLVTFALAASAVTGCYHRRYGYGPGYYGRPGYVVRPQPVYVQPQPVYVQPQPVYVQQPAYQPAQVVVQPGY